MAFITLPIHIYVMLPYIDIVQIYNIDIYIESLWYIDIQASKHILFVIFLPFHRFDGLFDRAANGLTALFIRLLPSLYEYFTTGLDRL